MSDVKDYCEQMNKRLIGLKAGLYDVIKRVESVSDAAHSEAAKSLDAIVKEIEAGLEDLTNQCPSDWSPNRKVLDDNMTKLTETLNDLATNIGVKIPDSTAWI